jgi:hypothetical protein
MAHLKGKDKVEPALKLRGLGSGAPFAKGFYRLSIILALGSCVASVVFLVKTLQEPVGEKRKEFSDSSILCSAVATLCSGASFTFRLRSRDLQPDLEAVSPSNSTPPIDTERTSIPSPPKAKLATKT